MRMTHKPDTPWSKVYQPNQNNEIPCELIDEWVKRSPLHIDKDPTPDNQVTIAKLDASGHPFLPEGWEED